MAANIDFNYGFSIFSPNLVSCGICYVIAGELSAVFKLAEASPMLFSVSL